MSDLDEIREQCQHSKTLYEDPNFPVDDSSIYYDGRKANIEWKRPKDICGSPKFVSETASRHDLVQGDLGNCWFLAGCGALTTEMGLFTRVCPLDQGFDNNYVGAFHFNIWRYGGWEEVVIDDRLPTRNNRLVFCSNRQDKSEFWSALVEKAYAKVHGSYQALELGFAIDALVDFTGGIGEFIDLHKVDDITQLQNRVVKLHNMDSFLCAAIEPVGEKPAETALSSGLVAGHVYSITDVRQVELNGDPTVVLRLRNPWGKKEWSGSWSDGSSEWSGVSEEEKEAMSPKNLNDGEFWMSFVDFQKNFDSLQICHLTADSMRWRTGRVEWNSQTYHGGWSPGSTAGGCGVAPNEDEYWLNPQYWLEIGSPVSGEKGCTVVISLMQKDARVRKSVEKKKDTEYSIGFDIHRLIGDAPEDFGSFHAGPGSVQVVHKFIDYEYFRERSKVFSLPPGNYCIIPCTYQVGREAEYILRILSETTVNSGEMEPSINETNVTAPRVFKRLFNEYSGDDGVIDARELRKLLNNGIKRDQDDDFSKETCRALIQEATGERRGTLSRAACRAVWRKVGKYQQTFDKYDKDCSGFLDVKELRRAFKSFGVTVRQKTISSIAERFCAKSDNLSLDEFILCAIKVTKTTESYRRRGGKAEGSSKVEMSLDQMLELSLN